MRRAAVHLGRSIKLRARCFPRSIADSAIVFDITFDSMGDRVGAGTADKNLY